MPSRVELVRVKLERAKEHILDLEARILLFTEKYRKVIVAENDSNTGDLVFKFGTDADVPPDWRAIVGDVLQNLRSCLDHLAWQLVLANGGTPSEKGAGSTGFPIAETPEKYATLIAKGKVEGMCKVARQRIDAYKPYHGGNPAFWMIHDLNNFDKHRLLFVVAYSYSPSPLQWRIAWARYQSGVPGAAGKKPQMHIFPLKDGQELLRIPARFRDSDMQDNPKFTFEVSFSKSEVGKGEPLIPTLHYLADFVDSVVGTFEDVL